MDDVTALRDAVFSASDDIELARAVNALIAAVEARAALTPERLAVQLDEHWLVQEPTRAVCSCGGWSLTTVDAVSMALGTHLLPFSRHCAEASLAALRDEVEPTKRCENCTHAAHAGDPRCDYESAGWVCECQYPEATA